MTTEGPGQRLRLRVADIDEAVFDLAPADVGPPERRDEVRSLVASSDERAAGIRRFEVTVDGWVLEVSVEVQSRALLRERAGQGSGRRGPSGADVVKAQIPGRVVRLWVSEGDTVEAGQRLLAIEAMKMENEVRATRGGTIGAIRVAVGGSVELGDELLAVR